MEEEIKIENDRIIIFSEGKDGSIYERTIYLRDKKDDKENSVEKKEEEDINE